MCLLLGIVLLQILNLCYGESFLFCKTSNPNADVCLMKAIENALHRLETDFPEFELKTIEPYSFPKITFEAGSGAVHFAQHYKKLKLSGYSNGVVKNAHFDEKKKVLSWSANFPKIVQKGEYILNGQLLALPITGSDNMGLTNTIEFEEYEKKGSIYFKIKSYVLSFAPGKMVCNFENLFNGNKLLGDNVNKMINDEWALFFNDIKDTVNSNYGEVFRQYAEMFFSKVPAKVIFPS